MSLPFWYPPILAYHCVNPQPVPNTPTVTPETFDRQMRILATDWDPVPLSELADCFDRGRQPARRAVAVTFDDGVDNVFTHALPVMKRYRIPATVFVVGSHINSTNALTAGQIRELAAAGVEIGSHTMRHAYLPSLTLEQARAEMVDSKRRIESEGVRVQFISYPGGGYTPELAAIAREAGYRGACTTNRGVRRFPPDRWALRRISMSERTRGPAGIWLRCCGYYGLNRRLRSPS